MELYEISMDKGILASGSSDKENVGNESPFHVSLEEDQSAEPLGTSKNL